MSDAPPDASANPSATTTLPPPAPPVHVAIIMDGNGRWARQRGLPRLEGHRRGADAVRAAIEGAQAQGIRYLTLYAFSSENWKRPQDEVGGLMNLLEHFLKRETKTLVKNRIRLRTIGRTDALPPPVRAQLAAAIEATAPFTEHTLILALNYGSRIELTDTVRRIAVDAAAGTLTPDAITWDAIAARLDTADIPDPDLVIRTSGEMRISNFLLLQAAYAEFIFTPVLWPDFRETDLAAAVAEYHRRERRFGCTGEQINASSQ
ncbi:di-trans,poly-cis-decaprenylcistransferase [Opitutaceae bacterium TAV4]|nr:di-trans,poly-cis-decaprenylcistransferase [Opitutaceae bacterium TAV4]RRK01545.1 di-trans,poly-cis-decaprenylcistransferase [Opitutaceae bacterium TAV3]